MTNQERRRNQDCRREVRAYLAERAGLAIESDRIAAGLRVYSQAEVDLALDYLKKLKPEPHVLCHEQEDAGGLYHWEITSDGVRAYERQ